MINYTDMRLLHKIYFFIILLKMQKLLTLDDCLKYGEYEIMETFDLERNKHKFPSNCDISDVISYKNNIFLNKLSEDIGYVSNLINYIVFNKMSDKLEIFDKLLDKLKYSTGAEELVSMIEKIDFEKYGSHHSEHWIYWIDKMEKYVERCDIIKINSYTISHKKLLEIVKYKKYDLLRYINRTSNINDICDLSDNDILNITKYGKIVFNKFKSKDIGGLLKELENYKRIYALTDVYVEDETLLFDIFVKEKLNNRYKYQTSEEKIFLMLYDEHNHAFANNIIMDIIAPKDIISFIDRDAGIDQIIYMKFIKIFPTHYQKRKLISTLLCNNEEIGDIKMKETNRSKLLNIMDYYTGFSKEAKKKLGIYKEPSKVIFKQVDFKIHDLDFDFF